MGSLSDYAEASLLKHISTEAAYTPVATLKLALCTADPTDAATGASMNEVANSGSYARTTIAFGAAASRRVTQSGTVTFPAATGSWGTVSHWAIVDSATYGAGNVLAAGAFTVPKSIVSGNTPSVASAEVYVELTASTGLSNYFANGFLDRMFRNQALTVSATYLAVVTAAPTDASTGSTITEPSGNNYARKQINTTGGASPAWSAVTGTAPTTLTNNQAVTMATPSGSWGTITNAAICDALTVGNLLWYFDVTDQLVSVNDTVQFSASGGITLTET
jgi:hypothetical protein